MRPGEGREATARAHGPRRVGLWLALASAAAFGSRGAFAKSLLVGGWSPGAIVTAARHGAAARAARSPRCWRCAAGGRPCARNVPVVLGYGAVAVAGCQVAYFYAVQRLAVGVALLLEYLGVVLVVGWLWAAAPARPAPLTRPGWSLAVVGLVLVLDLGGGRARPRRRAWGLVAAAGLASLLRARRRVTTTCRRSRSPAAAWASARSARRARGPRRRARRCAVRDHACRSAARRAVVGRGRSSWPSWPRPRHTSPGIAAARMLGSTVASFVA